MKRVLFITLGLITFLSFNSFAISIPGQPSKQIPAYKSANDITENIEKPVAENINKYDNTAKPEIVFTPSSAINYDISNNVGANIIWSKDGRNSFRDNNGEQTVSAIDRFFPLNKHFSGNNTLFIPSNSSVKVNMNGFTRIKFLITIEDTNLITSGMSMVVRSGETILCKYNNFVPKSIDNYYVWVDEGTSEIEISFENNEFYKTDENAKLLIINPEVYN